MDKNREEVPLRVALYLRVSTEDQVDKYGLDAQRSAIEGVLKSRGKLKNGEDALILAGKAFEYLDEGVSGTKKIDERPALRRLKEDLASAPIGSRPFDIVAVFKLDRFARKLSILLNIFDLFKENDVEFISATESIDTSTPFGRAMFGIMGVIAELELETIKDRTQRGREQAIYKGVVMGGNAIYGYQKDANKLLVIQAEESEIVKRIYSLFLYEKLPPQKIADILTEDEVLSPDGSAVKHNKRKGISRKFGSPYFWRAERVREVLSNDVYTGIEYVAKTKKGKAIPKNDRVISPHRHEAIVFIHLFELAQEQLKDLSDRKALTEKKKEGHVYPLSGLLKCDHCKELVTTGESGMMRWTGGKKLVKGSAELSYYYFCGRKNIKKYPTTCDTVPIPADQLEEYVIDFIKQILSNPQAVYEHQQQLPSNKLHTSQLEAKKRHFEELFNSLPQMRENLRFEHEIGDIDTPKYLKRLEELKAKEIEYPSKISELDYQLSQVALPKGYEASFKAFAEKYGTLLDEIVKDKEQLYQLIHMLVYQIVVYSRPRTEKDIIAGRKKENQFIPNRIDIYFNLPQRLLQQLYTHQFGVRSDVL